MRHLPVHPEIVENIQHHLAELPFQHVLLMGSNTKMPLNVKPLIENFSQVFSYLLHHRYKHSFP
jgi:hypothetical protein